ncbi:MAG: 4-alpha-glucanotransferase [Rhodoferax sp.]
MQFQRASGVLVHITSLPGAHGSGDLGPAAFHFVDWLRSGGQTLWQFLPLGGIGLGHSPYMGSSAFGGNVLLIDLAELHQKGWLEAQDLFPTEGMRDRAINFPEVIEFRMARLARANARFQVMGAPEDRADLANFSERHASWLNDYALFMALAEHLGAREWTDWDAPLARRDPQALAAAAQTHAAPIDFWKFCQWCFFRQWRRLKAYANARGVRLVGDVPIFVAQQSADVWVRPELFELDTQGRPIMVAGVPPDTFSDTGQRWGNPLYRWSAHEGENFVWWISRVRHVFEMVDIARIDHFRGFESCWEIPATEPTAVQGRWVAVPGDALFTAIADALGPLPIIAEDLGVITTEVTALRKKHGFPGMRVLQFGWGADQIGDAHHLPHTYEPGAVVYPGTHDNDTTLGWWNSVPDGVRHHVRDYLAFDGTDVGWAFIRAACASVAELAIYPLQDVLRLSGEHRMNKPGTPEGNWRWRFMWADVGPEHAALLKHLSRLYGRLPQDTAAPGKITG